jgi:uncharacterized protein YbaA (DUF1428 family)
MDRAAAIDWLDAYLRLWRTPGTSQLNEIFSDAAEYIPGPFADTLVGLPAIAKFWDAARDGAEENFSAQFDLLAVDGDVAVVFAEIEYKRTQSRIYRDLWIVKIAEDGRAYSFAEWPFFPGQPLSYSGLEKMIGERGGSDLT